MKKYVAICGTVAALTWVGSSLAVSGSAMSSSAGPATSDRGGAQAQAAAYYLLGDTTNSGASATKFNTTDAGNAWSFFSSGLSATALYSSCPNGTACWGVEGVGTGIGVYGTASNATGSDSRGVQGSGGSTAANGTSYGGYFSASNAASGGKSNGVYGAGSTTGVYATSSGNGVYATSTGGSGNAVYAKGSGSSFYGVWGDVGGNGYGIVGSSSGGPGVYGSSTGNTGAANVAGVYGFEGLSAVGSASATNSGVFGTCANCNGVFGTSANFTGVRGSVTGGGANTYGGYFSSTKGTGVYVTTGGITALRAGQPQQGQRPLRRGLRRQRADQRQLHRHRHEVCTRPYDRRRPPDVRRGGHTELLQRPGHGHPQQRPCDRHARLALRRDCQPEQAVHGHRHAALLRDDRPGRWQPDLEGLRGARTQPRQGQLQLLLAGHGASQGLRDWTE